MDRRCSLAKTSRFVIVRVNTSLLVLMLSFCHIGARWMHSIMLTLVDDQSYQPEHALVRFDRRAGHFAQTFYISEVL